jgi:hypothetical protein
MIIEAYTLVTLTRSDAEALHRELLQIFDKQKAKDFPQLAQYLKDLSQIIQQK